MTPSSTGIRLRIVAAVALSLVAGAAWGGWYGRRMSHWAADCPVLPAFVEPGTGARAPHNAAFGFEIGRARMNDVAQVLAGRGLSCADAGVRTLLAANRARLLAEQARRRAHGESLDSITGASALRRKSPMERNPQVRLRCDDVSEATATANPRSPAGHGQLLFVFDSPTLPLRHVSFQQTFGDAAEAAVAFHDRVASLTSVYGPPTVRPVTDGDKRFDLPWLKPVEASWRFADLTVRLSALNFGVARGVSVGETIEVPWPVRPDAPARS